MNPFNRVEIKKYKSLFWPLLGLSILSIIGMQVLGAPLINEVAPGGILTFELIGSLTGSQSIIESWQGSAMTWAGLQLGLDFLFLFLYALTIALACLILIDRLPRKYIRTRTMGNWSAIGVLVAGVLDIIENIALHI